MEFKNVKLTDKKVKQIYESAFPKAERMPFALMVAMSKLWHTKFLALYEKDAPCGFIYLAKNRNLVFIMFFAVDRDLRSNGYGSKILEEIKRFYPSKKIIVSIEPCIAEAEDLQTRQRRKSFYLRNGFCESGWYMRLNKVEQEILIANGTFSKRQFISFFAHYSNGTVWPKLWKKK